MAVHYSFPTLFTMAAERVGRPRLLQHRRTPWQQEFVDAPQTRKLARAANRVGKTVSEAEDLALRMCGWHPHQRHRPALRGLAMGPTIAQMASSGLLPWLWFFLEGDPITGHPGPWIDPRLRYEPGSGIRGTKEPVIRLVDGPGRGGIIQVCSYDQGTKRLGGYSAHAVVLDEPPPEARWSEVRARVLDVGGTITIGFTPTPTSPDVTYLRRIVEAEGHTWHHQNVHLTPEATWVQGAPFPRLTDARIKEFAGDLLGRERRMRLEGWWEVAVEGAILDAFDPDVHVRDFGLADIPRGAQVAVGVDHGVVGNKQRAVLVAFSQERTMTPRAWYLGEYLTLGTSTSREDAQGILDMLASVGLDYDHVDVWVGDRDVRSSKSAQATIKSNRELRRQLAHLLGRTMRRVKPIHAVQKYNGSVWDGCRLMNGMLLRQDNGVPHAMVHPRCPELARAMARWDGDKKHPLKDVLDAARYATERVCRLPSKNSGRLVAMASKRVG